MTDYTPSIKQMRGAYIGVMRRDRTRSAGQLDAEFDRFIAMVATASSEQNPRLWVADELAAAWDEGHKVARMADPVGCTCAYMECWCDANYEQTYTDTRADNPYRTDNEGKQL